MLDGNLDGKISEGAAEDVGKKWTTRWWIFNPLKNMRNVILEEPLNPKEKGRWKLSKHVWNHHLVFHNKSLQNQSFLGCHYIPLKINLVTTSNLIFFHLDPSVESSFNWESYDCKAKNGPVGSTCQNSAKKVAQKNFWINVITVFSK